MSPSDMLPQLGADVRYQAPEVNDLSNLSLVAMNDKGAEATPPICMFL